MSDKPNLCSLDLLREVLDTILLLTGAKNPFCVSSCERCQFVKDMDKLTDDGESNCIISDFLIAWDNFTDFETSEENKLIVLEKYNIVLSKINSGSPQ